MLEQFLPKFPTWALDWQKITEMFPWIQNLRGSTQDPIHHAEGDVWIHTKMVCEAMIESPEWRSLSNQERLETFAAALLHDVCKPHTRTIIDGRISNPGHSKMGSIEARQILWHMGFDFISRERVCQMIRIHQIPFWLIEKEEWEVRKTLIQSSLIVPNKFLAVLAEADAKGRIAVDRNKIIENVTLFRMLAEECNTYIRPYNFANDHTRFEYFRSPETKQPNIELYDTTDHSFVMTLMCGLPASGKSTLAKEQNQPIVSFDDMFKELDTDNQGHVVQAVRERAREHLRRKQSFVWDSTNISKQFRSLPIQMATDYGARVRIIYVEAPAEVITTRNAARTDSKVPHMAIQKMMNKWEVPTLAECHQLEFIGPM